jgi:hypothetical protein
MDLKWNQMPENIQLSLEHSLLLRLRWFNPIDFSWFLKGARKMNYSWTNRTGIKEGVFRGFLAYYGGRHPHSQRKYSANSKSFASIIFEMGEAGLEWSSLPNEVQKTCFRGIDSCSASFDLFQISFIIHA